MSEEFIIINAVIYASIVALTYKKVGLLAALLFPLTIILMGIMVYLTVLTQPRQPPADE
jgi:uncharacterized membrane protein YagU involved in acid resistance